MLEQLPLYQRVYTKEQTVSLTYGAPFVLPLYYETSDGDTNLSGLTLNIHYNSAFLHPDAVNNQHSEVITKATYLKDTKNLDADLNTDSILQLLWMSFDSSFPGVSQPALLANISWFPGAPKPGSDGLPPLTSGQAATTSVIRYTASEVADGYAFAQDYTVIDFTPVPPPAPTYSLSADQTTYNEGDTIKVTVQTTDIAVNYLYYTWGGTNITSNDFTYDGNLYGGVGAPPKYPRFGTIQLAAGVGTFEQTLLKDELTEGVETLEIQLYKDYDKTIPIGNLLTLSIQDTSITPIVTPPTGEITDYSNDPLQPTPIIWAGTAPPYNAKISNSVGTATDTADYLTFVVPTGQRLTSLRLENYNSTDAKAFIGIQEGNTVTASASNPAPLLGYTHFGPGVSDATVGSDLISKFGGPLTEGTYSIWIQQLGAPTNYTLNLTLEQVQTVTPAYPINIPKTTAGTEVKIADTTHPAVLITSNGSPDYIQVQAPVSVTLDALSSGTHTAGYIARNVGTPNTPGTGQVVYLNGLSKYSFVETAIEAATTTINLEPSKNSAFFLHDAYSAFYSGLTLSPDSNGRQSTQRVLNVDKIKMGSAGGTSIVDLTSKDYITGDVTIYSAQKGRSIIWGGGSNDTMISNGADLIVYGGGGTNQIQLGDGKDTIQLRSGAGAKDRVIGFTPGVDKVELWTGNQEVGIEPQFLLSSDGQSSVMSWAGNTVEFVGIPSLDLATLLPLGRMAA